MSRPEKYYTADILKQLAVIFLLLFACSCSISLKKTNYTKLTPAEKIDLLYQDLSGLSGITDSLEARHIAETGIIYSLKLADEYRLVRPPYLHNILVQLGIKKRGLCYHWADDLKKKLSTLGLKSFDIHLGVSGKGSILREHNCVVITARGRDFNEGIVFDPWRNSGDLYWGPVKTDKYTWKKL